MSATYAPLVERRTRSRVGQRTAFTLWVLSFVAIPVWIHFETPGWDPAIYVTAIHSVRAGHDPYADAIAVQQLFHSQLALHPNAQVPYSYVYSPLTLPLVRLVGALPLWLAGTIFWLLYAAGVLVQTWAGLQSQQEQERRFFRFMAPVACFFPGLLASDILLSGNVAFILYALVLLAAVWGWRREQWKWFYLAVIAASCVKAPLLSLVVIPVFSARKQWLAATLSTAMGLALFALQPLLWPSLFRHYLQAVELQFSYNRDFGCSPAGLFSDVLVNRGIPYSPAASIVYLAYALPLLGFLFYLSKRFFRGEFSLQQWAPVLLLGVILLNPRIQEYDTAPLALPMAFIGWRFMASLSRAPRNLIFFSLLFAITNVIAYHSWNVWKITEGVMLVAFFAAGSYTLLSQQQTGARASQDLPRRRVQQPA